MIVCSFVFEHRAPIMLMNSASCRSVNLRFYLPIDLHILLHGAKGEMSQPSFRAFSAGWNHDSAFGTTLILSLIIN